MQIEIESVRFSYSTSSRVLDGISLHVPSGTTCALMGTSGNGKSTLLRLVAGLLPRLATEELEGRILVDSSKPRDRGWSGELGLVAQEPVLLPHLTVEENLKFPADRATSYDATHALRLLELVGLTQYRKRLPGNLSVGMKSRLALARAFSTRPKLLLLDEPFSALDIGWRTSLHQLLLRLKREVDATMLIVTHDLREACVLADKVCVISHTGTLAGEFAVLPSNHGEVTRDVEALILADLTAYLAGETSS